MRGLTNTNKKAAACLMLWNAAGLRDQRASQADYDRMWDRYGRYIEIALMGLPSNRLSTGINLAALALGVRASREVEDKLPDINEGANLPSNSGWLAMRKLMSEPLVHHSRDQRIKRFYQLLHCLRCAIGGKKVSRPSPNRKYLDWFFNKTDWELFVSMATEVEGKPASIRRK